MIMNISLVYCIFIEAIYGSFLLINDLINFCYICLQRTDESLLAQFFYTDEELNEVASELDSFDGRKDPERCAALVTQLRASQVGRG